MLQESTSSHTLGRLVAERDGENEAVLTQRRHTEYPTPSSLGPAPLKTESCDQWRERKVKLWRVNTHTPHINNSNLLSGSFFSPKFKLHPHSSISYKWHPHSSGNFDLQEQTDFNLL